eukprot:1143054-Prorocentrum_minimum.AAC.4
MHPPPNTFEGQNPIQSQVPISMILGFEKYSQSRFRRAHSFDRNLLTRAVVTVRGGGLSAFSGIRDEAWWRSGVLRASGFGMATLYIVDSGSTFGESSQCLEGPVARRPGGVRACQKVRWVSGFSAVTANNESARFSACLRALIFKSCGSSDVDDARMPSYSSATALYRTSYKLQKVSTAG